MKLREARLMLASALAKRYWVDFSVDQDENHFYSHPEKCDRYQIELTFVRRVSHEKISVRCDISYSDFESATTWIPFVLSCVHAAVGHRQLGVSA
jgi:hypothetical protein